MGSFGDWFEKIDWWYVRYDIFGWKIGVNWKMVLGMVLFWIAMWFGLPPLEEWWVNR